MFKLNPVLKSITLASCILMSEHALAVDSIRKNGDIVIGAPKSAANIALSPTEILEAYRVAPPGSTTVIFQQPVSNSNIRLLPNDSFTAIVGIEFQAGFSSLETVRTAADTIAKNNNIQSISMMGEYSSSYPPSGYGSATRVSQQVSSLDKANNMMPDITNQKYLQSIALMTNSPEQHSSEAMLIMIDSMTKFIQKRPSGSASFYSPSGSIRQNANSIIASDSFAWVAPSQLGSEVTKYTAVINAESVKRDITTELGMEEIHKLIERGIEVSISTGGRPFSLNTQDKTIAPNLLAETQTLLLAKGDYLLLTPDKNNLEQSAKFIKGYLSHAHGSKVKVTLDARHLTRKDVDNFKTKLPKDMKDIVVITAQGTEGHNGKKTSLSPEASNMLEKVQKADLLAKEQENPDKNSTHFEPLTR